jgi:hypothetical protein
MTNSEVAQTPGVTLTESPATVFHDQAPVNVKELAYLRTWNAFVLANDVKRRLG